MFKSFMIGLILSASVLNADFEYTLTNTNLTISQGSFLPHENKRYLYNYDRFRFDGSFVKDSFFVRCIADGVNYLGDEYTESSSFNYVKSSASDTPFRTQTSFHDYDKGSVYAKLYRLYGGYEDNDKSIIFGVQNIPMGVGRVWTPTNMFNPKNTYALEPDEIFGVLAFSYTQHLDDTSYITLVSSQRAEHSFKYAMRYKTFFEFADFGINLISSDKTTMLGYEIEGDLAETGIELRSEGGYIKSTLQTFSAEKEEEFFQGILGADYGFENGLNVAFESLYSSQKFSDEEIILNLNSDISSDLVPSSLYTAFTLSYSVNIFLDASFLYIESFDNTGFRFISPGLRYTFNDYNVFSMGAMIQKSRSESGFTGDVNRYYLKYVLSF